MMKKILGYILSPLFWIGFGLLITIFHPFQVILLHVVGDKSRKRSVEIMNYFLLKNFLFLGSNVKIIGREKLTMDRPIIIISNHQSMMDVPPVVWAFKKYYPRFIAKVELGKWIPSISYNLVKGGSAMIDRKNKGQAIKEIIKLGRLVEKEKYAVCIYPEGTRSRNGKLKPFQSAGVASLLRTAPSAIIIPFVIDGNSRVFENGVFPLNVGQKITYSILDPIETKDRTAEELVIEAENAIRTALGQ